MTVVRILKSWSWPDLRRQTPGRTGCWQGVEFTTEPITECDYAVILNGVPANTMVKCPPDHVWVMMQEPPVAEYKALHRGTGGVARIYTQAAELTGPQYMQSPGALPWHVERDYDFLKNCPPPEKPRSLSWITSNLTTHEGHRARMAFLQTIRGKVEFDLWGKGFTPIDDKWDGLAHYRYALAVENYSGPHYWTEKLADCFLSWTMPIYFGCTNITDYFPAESMVLLDIHDPDAVRLIREAVASERWLRQREAIAYARQLVLDKYQLYPFLTGQIQQLEQSGGSALEPAVIQVAAMNLRWPMQHRLQRRVQQLVKRGTRVTRSD